MGDTSRRDYRRPDGETLYWPMGPFKLRLPFLHYISNGLITSRAC